MSSQLLPLHPTQSLPSAGCCSLVTAIRRGWVSHSFPRPVIAGKGHTLSFSQQGNHGSSHAWCYKSWRVEKSALHNYPSTTTFGSPSSDITSCAVYSHLITTRSTILTLRARLLIPDIFCFCLYSCILMFFFFLRTFYLTQKLQTKSSSKIQTCTKCGSYQNLP